LLQFSHLPFYVTAAAARPYPRRSAAGYHDPLPPVIRFALRKLFFCIYETFRLRLGILLWYAFILHLFLLHFLSFLGPANKK
jgi:hypothetical protein